MARTCLPTTCLRCGAVLLLGEGTRAEPHLPRARWQPATAGVEQHRGHGWRLVVNQLSKRALDILAHYDWTDKALHYRLSSTSRTSFHEHLLPQFRPPLPRPPHLLTSIHATSSLSLSHNYLAANRALSSVLRRPHSIQLWSPTPSSHPEAGTRQTRSRAVANSSPSRDRPVYNRAATSRISSSTTTSEPSIPS